MYQEVTVVLLSMALYLAMWCFKMIFCRCPSVCMSVLFLQLVLLRQLAVGTVHGCLSISKPCLFAAMGSVQDSSGGGSKRALQEDSHLLQCASS